MKNVKTSVRHLVEFILRSGDLKSGGSLKKPEAMLEGSRIHRKLQKGAKGDYRAEVPLTFTKEYEGFSLTVEGRADGIYTSRKTYVIDEIKGTYTDLEEMKEPVPVHLAQARVYAYIYAHDNDLKKIKVRMRYCHLVSEDIKSFEESYTFEELQTWFDGILAQYYKWAEFIASWRDIRDESIKGMQFPFEYRPGQQQLTADVYRSILRKKQLFVRAATGTGKTMSTVFPSVIALSEGLIEKIFYLTAKTVAANVAEEAFSILADKGARIKALRMTSKERICPCEETDCDPSVCKYAKGHFDRVNDVLYEILTSEDMYERNCISAAAERTCVCPYELQKDLEAFTDATICDYNYVFDPAAKMKGYFGDEPGKKPESVFLIDEAHNLVERARDMFSASLFREEFVKFRAMIPEKETKLISACSSCIRALGSMKKEMNGARLVKTDISDKLLFSLMRLTTLIEEYLERVEDRQQSRKIMDFYFDIKEFTAVCDLVDENYIIYEAIRKGGDFELRLFCVNPAANLAKVMDGSRSAVMFSATLIPVNYYKELLSEEEEPYAVYVESPFPKENRIILSASDVTSIYSKRGTDEYLKFAQYLKTVTESKRGKYMAFFSSYEMLEEVGAIFESIADIGLDIRMQKPDMTEDEKQSFLRAFDEENSWLIGLCIMGGIFGEGIDLSGDKLIGAIVIGAGLPGVSEERGLLKDYFDENGKDGFKHAYLFPGMNKVQQSAGRVIRTMSDKGVILLLDSRFGKRSYIELFPREWNDVKSCTLGNVREQLAEFWKNLQMG